MHAVGTGGASDEEQLEPQQGAAGADDAQREQQDEPGGADEAGTGGSPKAGGSGGALPALSNKKLKKLKEKYDKRGIIYISRIPPHMKPQKLRQMLEQYGEVGRVYLAPEDPAARRKRKQAGGNSGKNFTEGWVEFEDKAQAKEVAALLNGTQMGGRRRSAYFYDLWCIKYLPKFKWDHLTEEINYQKAVREQRLAAEISAAKRERDFYLSRVDKAKAVTAMLERKRKRGEAAASDGDGGSTEAQPPAKQRGGVGGAAAGEQGLQTSPAAAGGAEGLKVLRTYGQRKPKADPVTDASAPMLSSGLLQLIAGKPRGPGSVDD